MNKNYLEKNVDRKDFSDQFRKIIRIRYKKPVMRQTACLEVNPITVNNFAAGGSGLRSSTIEFLLLQHFSVGLAVEYSSCFISLLDFDLYVCCFDVLMS